MTITIKDKTIGLLFGMKAVEGFFNRVQIGTKVTAELMVELIWAGVENWYYRERKEPEVQFSDVYDFVEDQFMSAEGRDYLGRIYKAFEDSQAVKTLTEAGKKSKKK